MLARSVLVHCGLMTGCILHKWHTMGWILCVQAHGYFADGEGEVAGRMEEVERLCDALSIER